VSRLGIHPGRIRRALFVSTNLPAAIAIVVIALLGIFADHQNSVVYQQRLRAETLAKVNLVRAKLEGNINGTIQLVRGLVSTLMTEPKMTQDRFAELARNLFKEDSQLRNIAAAPGLVVTLMYPVEGNERAVGLDYRADGNQREAALRARDTGQLVLAGPVELKQGGQGFIGRFPVFIETSGPHKRFWGIVSAVIDVDRLYRDSGLFDEDSGIEIALTGHDATGVNGKQFFGRPDMAWLDPVRAEVVLPSGTWQVSAIPVGGWGVTPANAWLLRLLVVFAGVVVVIPMATAGRLFATNQRHLNRLRRTEKEQRALSQRLALALDASRIGVWEHDLTTHQLIWDDRVNEIYGKKSNGRPRSYMDWAGSIHPADLARAKRDFDSALTAGHYSSEYRVVHADRTIRHVRTRAVVFSEPNEPPKMIGAEWDVTADVKLNRALVRAKTLAEKKNAELEAAKARIEHNALHDSLTGLPNRRYLDELLERHAAEKKPGDGPIALLHIDLDRFKQINDTLGHAAGDAMLVHAAGVIKANVREKDFVARIGGDEFVVVCRTDAGAASLSDIAERIILHMRKPVSHEGHQCRFGVSIGIAVEGSGKPLDPSELLVNADIALYRAKSRGRNRHEFFTRTVQAEIVRNKRIADDILGGLERNEFMVYYQPQFDAHTFEIAGVEALARWAHPTEGILAPDMFLKTAEELNVVATIDRIVLEQALLQFDEWNRSEVTIPHISVNVSAKRLKDEELVAGLNGLNIQPGTVSFELLESIFLDDNDEMVVWNVDRIKDLGIDIEIDDFGTGYASIIGLLKLKPQRLKIDRQLITPITGSPRQKNLVQSIIEIGKSLGIEVVAEGVETMEHARILRTLGCDKLQGYAFAKPMKAAALGDFVRARSWRAAS